MPLRDPKVPEFLALNPNGQVPVLIDGDFVLSESNAVLVYLAEREDGRLLPEPLKDRARVLQWLSWQGAELSTTWGYAFLGLARRGYGLGMDHVHRGLTRAFRPSFERRAACIKRLADAGFARNIFLSQDVELGGQLLPAQARAWRETIDPPQGLLFTTRRLIPHLREIGVSQSDIHAMTVDNPRRFFSLV